jgi:hypothetical protein
MTSPLASPPLLSIVQSGYLATRVAPRLSTSSSILKTIVSLDGRVKLTPPQDLDSFQPFSFFFYGSLIESDALQHILELDEPSVVEKAYVKGFKIKLMGTYPVLLPGEDQ